MTAEERRLEEARERKLHWKRWGPYLSGTPVGNGSRGLQPLTATAWDYFPHDHARLPRLSLGRRRHRRHFATEHQLICFFSVALWNGTGSPS